MTGSVKLFQFVQQCGQIVGIHPCQSNQKYLSTSLTRTIFLICWTQCVFTTVGFFVFEAKSMFAYGFSCSIAICVINAIVVYLIFIWQSGNTLKFIENCEGFIDKSKYIPQHGLSDFEKIWNSSCFSTKSFSVFIFLFSQKIFKYISLWHFFCK